MAPDDDKPKRSLYQRSCAAGITAVVITFLVAKFSDWHFLKFAECAVAAYIIGNVLWIFLEFNLETPAAKARGKGDTSGIGWAILATIIIACLAWMSFGGPTWQDR
jgi:hypothetical protein